ncbi:hypothetical protein VTI74DRAFT_9728 [Chaetomium olivicolor]
MKYTTLLILCVTAAQARTDYFFRFSGGNDVINGQRLRSNNSIDFYSPGVTRPPYNPEDHFMRASTNATACSPAAVLIVIPTHPHPPPVPGHYGLSDREGVPDAYRLVYTYRPDDEGRGFKYTEWQLRRTNEAGRVLLRYAGGKEGEWRWIAVKEKSGAGEVDKWVPWYVKCDETKPSCRACLRHGIECSLSAQTNFNSEASSSGATGSPSPSPSQGPTPPAVRKSRVQPINPAPKPQPPPSGSPGDDNPEALPSPVGLASTAAGSPAAASPDPFPYLAKFVTGPPEEDTANWVFDLELLHHFTTSTYSTFQLDAGRHETRRMWQVEVPKQAFVHIFLLHQILAISSYHLAYLNPQSRKAYSLRASQHQNAGIRGMRIALGAITPANCHALLASSSLLFIGSLAASSTCRLASEPKVDDLVDVIILVKGIGSVLDSSQDLLRTGPLAELFVNRGGTGQANPALDRVILAVEDFLVEIAEHEFDARVRAVVHADAYRLVACIRDSLVKTPVPEYRVVAAWPIHMSDDLIPLLRQCNQAALALLSYYCVVFHAAELQGYWFMQGWSSGVIKDVARTMAGTWKRHSAWALGWITGHATMG